MFTFQKLVGRPAGWFFSQKTLLRYLLFFIPLVNWFFEICIRWNLFCYRRSVFSFLVAVFVTLPFGAFFAYLDLIWALLTGHLLFKGAKRV